MPSASPPKLLLQCTYMYNVSMYMYSVIAVQTAIKQAKLEVDGEPVGTAFRWTRTYARVRGRTVIAKA